MSLEDLQDWIPKKDPYPPVIHYDPDDPRWFIVDAYSHLHTKPEDYADSETTTTKTTTKTYEFEIRGEVSTGTVIKKLGVDGKVEGSIKVTIEEETVETTTVTTDGPESTGGSSSSESVSGSDSSGGSSSSSSSSSSSGSGEGVPSEGSPSEGVPSSSGGSSGGSGSSDTSSGYSESDGPHPDSYDPHHARFVEDIEEDEDTYAHLEPTLESLIKPVEETNSIRHAELIQAVQGAGFDISLLSFIDEFLSDFQSKLNFINYLANERDKIQDFIQAEEFRDTGDKDVVAPSIAENAIEAFKKTLGASIERVHSGEAFVLTKDTQYLVATPLEPSHSTNDSDEDTSRSPHSDDLDQLVEEMMKLPPGKERVSFAIMSGILQVPEGMIAMVGFPDSPTEANPVDTDIFGTGIDALLRLKNRKKQTKRDAIASALEQNVKQWSILVSSGHDSPLGSVSGSGTMNLEQISNVALTLQSNIAIEDIPEFGSTVITYPEYTTEEEQEEQEENSSVEFAFSAFFAASPPESPSSPSSSPTSLSSPTGSPPSSPASPSSATGSPPPSPVSPP